MRRRLETLLEKSLIEKGYKLASKTYEGKRSEKVDSFVYVKSNGVVEYHVHLDNKRECVKYYCFTNSGLTLFTSGILDSLEEINQNFQQELKEIYDFENKCAREISYETPDMDYVYTTPEWEETTTLDEERSCVVPLDLPFIEESHFDEGDDND